MCQLAENPDLMLGVANTDDESEGASWHKGTQAYSQNVFIASVL